jgi:predicted nucleotidyltransferase
MKWEVLQQRLNQYPEIAAAYLFGSALTGKMTPVSDSEVALIVPESRASGYRLLQSGAGHTELRR